MNCDVCHHGYATHEGEGGSCSAWTGIDEACRCSGFVPGSLESENGSLGWWAISGEALLGLLKRAAAGEDPDLLYAEEYANGDHEGVG